MEIQKVNSVQYGDFSGQTCDVTLLGLDFKLLLYDYIKDLVKLVLLPCKLSCLCAY